MIWVGFYNGFAIWFNSWCVDYYLVFWFGVLLLVIYLDVLCGFRFRGRWCCFNYVVVY